ncbi:MAG: hypothetical protein L0215_06810 [Gemmataceae bacterium]|nr:hypothetical protein [Gemmataceae bacterium]
MKATQNDPVIDEIREVRRRISASCAHDPDKLVAHYKKLQEQHKERLIDKSKDPKQRDESAA